MQTSKMATVVRNNAYYQNLTHTAWKSDDDNDNMDEVCLAYMYASFDSNLTALFLGQFAHWKELGSLWRVKVIGKSHHGICMAF
jgi:hypothetical protein